jgi:hypothetical protein
MNKVAQSVGSSIMRANSIAGIIPSLAAGVASFPSIAQQDASVFD